MKKTMSTLSLCLPLDYEPPSALKKTVPFQAQSVQDAFHHHDWTGYPLVGVKFGPCLAQNPEITNSK